MVWVGDVGVTLVAIIKIKGRGLWWGGFTGVFVSGIFFLKKGGRGRRGGKGWRRWLILFRKSSLKVPLVNSSCLSLTYKVGAMNPSSSIIMCLAKSYLRNLLFLLWAFETCKKLFNRYNNCHEAMNNSIICTGCAWLVRGGPNQISKHQFTIR